MGLLRSAVSRSRTHLGSLVSVLVLGAVSLLGAGCDCAGTTEVPPDARIDASFDASVHDGGTMDAGRDAAAPDGSTPPDGGVDGGPPDVGPDAFCGLTTCDAECVDVETDPLHCGSCTGDCTALAHVDGTMVTCSDSACVLTGACEAGWADCNGEPDDGCETDLSLPETCGACGTVCGEPTPLCGLDESTSDRVCVSGCTGGTTRCDGSCVDLTTDAMHCGSCTTVCADPGHGTATCVDASCAPVCDAGYHACGEACSIDTDVSSCGSSCTPCATPPHATATCDGTACGFECIAPFADCNGDASDGCEVDTSTSTGNCSACGAACTAANGTPTCASSSCAIGACNPGFDDCNGLVSDGCETSLTTDASNCAACGFACNLANADAACAGGTCAVASCDAGFMDCDGIASNGCETNVLADPLACGTCGHVCMTPSATPSCTLGMCTIAGCDPGRLDCNGASTDGCEINTLTDAGNCGMCGRMCTGANATMACAGGGCVIAACTTGFADCNGNPADGCEVNLRTSAGNCGMCGRVCSVANGSPMCSSGICQVASCNPGFDNCNGVVADGCETNLTNTPSSCGTCGNNCALTCSVNVAATACSAGTCQITACTGGRFNIDGVCSNGCECATTGESAACLSPTSLGTLAIGQVRTFTGNLVPNGQEAYLSVTFTGNTTFSYHPRVRMTAGTSEFAFDILTNCAGAAMSCGVEGGNSRARTDWEVLYTAGDPSNPSAFNPIPAVGSGGTVIIHVFRRAGVATTCANYTLTITN